LTLFLLVVSIISFLFALGKNTPIFPFLYRYIPTFNMFQAPARFTIWAEFGLALLAGIGASNWIKPAGWTRYWTNLGIAAGAAVVLGSVLAMIFLPGVGSVFISATAIVGVIGMISGFLSKNAPVEVKQEPGKIWKWLVILLICIDLWLAHEGLNPGTSTSLYQTPVTFNNNLQSLLGNQRIYIDALNEEEIKYQRFFRFNSFIPQEDWINLKDVYLPDSSMLLGISSANNFDPVVPARYEFWMQYLDNTTLPVRNAMLQLMDVSVIEEVNSKTSTGISLTPLSGSARYHWSSCAVTAASEQNAWDLLINRLETSTNESGSLYAPVIIEGQEIPKSSCLSLSSAAIIPQVETPNRIVVKTQGDSGGWLVVADVWYPGWIAKVDGKTTALLHADYLFRGVAIPAGEHTVELVYQPVSFYAGVAISLLVLAGIIMTYAKGAKLCR
jgi:hypothetical protein